jgi:hypothetical protein
LRANDLESDMKSSFLRQSYVFAVRFAMNWSFNGNPINTKMAELIQL